MTRKEIQEQIDANHAEINRLRVNNFELAKEALLLCDEAQRFEEKEEDVIIKRRPKTIVKKLVGRIFWDEDFVDTDTGQIVTVAREQVVRVNGEWV